MQPFTFGMAESVEVIAEDDDLGPNGYVIGNILLHYRRVILVVAVLGAVIGLSRGLVSPRVYKSTATFLPQGANGPSSGLAAAASQLGFSLQSTGGAWTPAMYVELVKARSVLLPIVTDTFTVREQGTKHGTFLDLVGITGETPAHRVDAGINLLRAMVQASEDRKLGAVDIEVISKWPSLSLALARRLVDEVNKFNIETRKSQATAERVFVEAQVAEADTALRNAEARLTAFSQQNRELGASSNLKTERDRLEREVARLNQLYTSYLQSREEARIRQIRDTPVITVLDEPRLPLVGEPRRSLQKALVGGSLGFMLAALTCLLLAWWRTARDKAQGDAREFFDLLEGSVPSFLRGR
jgi:uncharacterized protein involved in exopolysaccharide biosynthesis